MRKVILRALGVLFTLYGLYVIAAGAGQWVRQLEQRDWEVRLATVQDVTRREERRGGFYRLHGTTVTVYDYTYEYFINSDRYTRQVTGTVTKQENGDLIDIKFDPEHPEHSTHILSVRWGALALNIGGAVVFCTIGLWLLDLRPAVRRMFSRKSE